MPSSPRHLLRNASSRLIPLPKFPSKRQLGSGTPDLPSPPPPGGTPVTKRFIPHRSLPKFPTKHQLGSGPPSFPQGTPALRAAAPALDTVTRPVRVSGALAGLADPRPHREPSAPPLAPKKAFFQGRGRAGQGRARPPPPPFPLHFRVPRSARGR